MGSIIRNRTTLRDGNPHIGEVQSVRWRKLPYWVFTPLAGALIGSIKR